MEIDVKRKEKHTNLQVIEDLNLYVREAAMKMRTIEENDRILENMWDSLADTPMNPDTEGMEEQYLHFPAETHREEIWHWFDDRYSKGVAHLLY